MREPPLSEVARGIPPFDSLAVVHLGMDAGAFARARPTARVLEYTGYRESIGGFEVVYAFLRPPIVRNAVPAGTLERVSTARDFTTEASARQMWDTLFAAGVRALHRPPDGCWSAHGALDARAHAAAWDEPTYEIAIVQWSMAARTALTVGQSPERVGVIVQTRGAAAHLATLPQRHRTACPK